MSSSSAGDNLNDDEFFVNAVKRYARPSCVSLLVRKELIKAAVRKSGDRYDSRNKNLLFPPKTIESVLDKGKLQRILACTCSVCGDPPGGRNILSDDALIDVITKKTGDEADQQRRLFAILIL